MDEISADPAAAAGDSCDPASDCDPAASDSSSSDVKQGATPKPSTQRSVTPRPSTSTNAEEKRQVASRPSTQRKRAASFSAASASNIPDAERKEKTLQNLVVIERLLFRERSRDRSRDRRKSVAIGDLSRRRSSRTSRGGSAGGSPRAPHRRRRRISEGAVQHLQKHNFGLASESESEAEMTIEMGPPRREPEVMTIDVRPQCRRRESIAEEAEEEVSPEDIDGHRNLQLPHHKSTEIDKPP